jgi:tetratricopeptide (TPR) repeat protein
MTYNPEAIAWIAVRTMRRRKTLVLAFCWMVSSWTLLSADLTQAAGQKAARNFELEGRLLDEQNKPFKGVTPVVFLQGITTPYTATRPVDRAGSFKFKNLAPTVYTLVAIVPKGGELRRTVDIGPSQADEKGRLKITVVWDSNVAERESTRIAVTQLSVPDKAHEDLMRVAESLERGDVRAAEALLVKLLQTTPTFAAAWNQLGVLCYQTRRFEEAERNFREALKQDPGSYPPLVNLGGALVSLRRYPEAVEVNQQAIQMRPDDPLAHSQLGNAWFGLDELNKAEECLRRAIGLEPGHFSFPQLRLARVYERQQKYGEVVYWATEFLRLHPDAPQATEARLLLEAARLR